MSRAHTCSCKCIGQDSCETIDAIAASRETENVDMVGIGEMDRVSIQLMIFGIFGL